ncbi:MAG: hypothetical protein K2M76_01980 [Muribaculaceae bacterium]|nr:hypothetical protein [Muribaculaceae bacterium]
MNTNVMLRRIAIATAIVLAGITVTSCEDETSIPADELYFNLELSPDYMIPCAGIDKSAYGNGRKLLLRSNGQWSIEPVDEPSDWLKVYPMEGEADGYLRIYADENTQAVTRAAQFKVMVNGVPQPDIITITQQNAEPFLKVNTAAVIFKRTGGDFTIQINANTDWEYALEGEGASMFVAATNGSTSLTLHANTVNESGNDINATLIIRGVGQNSSLVKTISVTQLYATFFDNFSWLESKAGINGWKIETGQKEVRIDSWSAAEKAHGWTSQSTWLYSRTGFIKFGKGGYGGDVASPCITEINGNSDVTISWSALGYATAKGVHDDISTYYVGILGPGTITATSQNGSTGAEFIYKDDNGSIVTLKAAQFDLGNTAWLDPLIDPTATEVWQYATSQFSMEVHGFTSESRVVFITGTGTVENAYQNANSKNSRLFLDNFKIVEN